MNIERLKQNLTEEGFIHIYEWHDEPGTKYPRHFHKDRVAMYILKGSLVFFFDDGIVELHRGDRFDVTPLKEHTAEVGPDGCDFFVGEMIEGDS